LKGFPAPFSTVPTRRPVFLALPAQRQVAGLMSNALRGRPQCPVFRCVCNNEGYASGFAASHLVTFTDQSQEPASGSILDLNNAIRKRHDETVYAAALPHTNGRGVTVIVLHLSGVLRVPTLTDGEIKTQDS